MTALVVVVMVGDGSVLAWSRNGYVDKKARRCFFSLGAAVCYEEGNYDIHSSGCGLECVCCFCFALRVRYPQRLAVCVRARVCVFFFLLVLHAFLLFVAHLSHVFWPPPHFSGFFFLLLISMLKKLHAAGNRVLVFSQMTALLDILQVQVNVCVCVCVCFFLCVCVCCCFWLSRSSGGR